MKGGSQVRFLGEDSVVIHCPYPTEGPSGLTHTFTTTSANEHDLNQAKHLIHGDETFISADSG